MSAGREAAAHARHVTRHQGGSEAPPTCSAEGPKGNVPLAHHNPPKMNPTGTQPRERAAIGTD